MRIEHAFEYNADYYEISDEFCANDSEYQAKVLNAIGTQFKAWAKDKARTMTYVQILEIAQRLNGDGKWFIETLSEYIKAESEGKA